MTKTLYVDEITVRAKEIKVSVRGLELPTGQYGRVDWSTATFEFPIADLPKYHVGQTLKVTIVPELAEK